jgi:putative ABC transport system ATP-binding protein
MNNIIETKNLTRTVNQKTIIDNFTFYFENHKIYNILGPSGAGKSSLLRLLNRLDEPTGGEIMFNNKDHCAYSSSELRSRIGYLFQTPYLFPRTIKDNILYAAPDLTESEMERILVQTHMSVDSLDYPVDNLSIGEQQRVALGRLLAMKPEVLLLDEPTAALDPTATEAIEQMIKEIVKQEKFTVLFVTHNPEQAFRMGGQALLLVKGRLIESGSSEQVINNPQTEMGRQYKEKKLK